MVARVEWTRETVVDALRRFRDAHDRWPKESEWQAAERLRGVSYPSYATVVSLCGSWQDALRVAGENQATDYDWGREPGGPGADPAPPIETDDPSLADLAVELAAAHRARASADERYRRAVEAFTEHEIVREINGST